MFTGIGAAVLAAVLLAGFMAMACGVGMGGIAEASGAATRPGFRFSRPELAKEFGQFCVKLHNGETKGLSPLVGGEGGYLVPGPEIAAEITGMMMTVGVAARIAREVPMGAGGFAQNRRLGGALAYWKTSGAAGTRSSPTFGRLDMRPETLMALVDVDIELEQDSMVALGNWLAGEFAYAMAYREDEAAFKGDGSAAYGGITGILNSDRVTIYNVPTAISAMAMTYQEYTLIEENVWEGALGNASWLCSRAIKAGWKSMTTEIGLPLWQFPMMGEPANFMGYPVHVSGLMPQRADDGASKKVVAFGDFRQGLYIGRRGAIAVDYSPAPGWTNLQNCWRAYERVDIAVNGFTAAEIVAHPELANPIAVAKTHA